MYRHPVLKSIALLTLLFIFLPLLLIMLTAFNEADIISLHFTGVSFKWFLKVFQSRSLMSALKMSFQISLKATILGICIGILASVALVKIPGKTSSALLSFFLSSSLIPGIVMGFVLFRFLVVKLALSMNASLMIGHLLIVLPYSIRLISAGLKECDASIEEAARTLGCKPFKAFVLVVLPDLKGAILSAFMMGFINSFNNIPVSMYLKGPGMNTLPYAMMNYIEYNYDPTASALSVMLMLVTVVFMVIIDKLTGKKSGGRK